MKNKVGIMGFTLAEVLITLSILGIIAAITIPNISRKIQDRQTIAKLNRAYSMIDNAMQMMIVEEGKNISEILEAEGFANYGYGDKFQQMINRYLPVKFTKGDKIYGQLPCENTTTWSKQKFAKYLDNSNFSSEFWYGCTVLKNGIEIRHNRIIKPLGYMNTSARLYFVDVIGYIYIDLDGFYKGPNRLGYDMYRFYYNKDGLMGDVYNCTDSCKNYRESDFGITKNACSGPNSNGTNCAYYIFKNNNLDYKYRDVGTDW